MLVIFSGSGGQINANWEEKSKIGQKNDQGAPKIGVEGQASEAKKAPWGDQKIVISTQNQKIARI